MAPGSEGVDVGLDDGNVIVNQVGRSEVIDIELHDSLVNVSLAVVVVSYTSILDNDSTIIVNEASITDDVIDTSGLGIGSDRVELGGGNEMIDEQHLGAVPRIEPERKFSGQLWTRERPEQGPGLEHGFEFDYVEHPLSQNESLVNGVGHEGKVRKIDRFV